jgi:hypothetical protein
MVRVRIECLRRPPYGLWREERWSRLRCQTSVYRHRNFADHLQRAAVVVAPCALAMEDLFGMSLFESESMPPGNGLCVNGEMYRKPKST